MRFEMIRDYLDFIKVLNERLWFTAIYGGESVLKKNVTDKPTNNLQDAPLMLFLKIFS